MDNSRNRTNTEKILFHNSWKVHLQFSKIHATFGGEMLYTTEKVEPCEGCEFCIYLYCAQKRLSLPPQMCYKNLGILNFFPSGGNFFTVWPPSSS